MSLVLSVNRKVVHNNQITLSFLIVTFSFKTFHVQTATTHAWKRKQHINQVGRANKCRARSKNEVLSCRWLKKMVSINKFQYKIEARVKGYLLTHHITVFASLISLHKLVSYLWCSRSMLALLMMTSSKTTSYLMLTTNWKRSIDWIGPHMCSRVMNILVVM